MISHEDQEVLDLVDDNDVVIGTILRGDYQRLVSEKLGFIRSVEVIIVNDQGKLWIPVRTASKKIAPNGLDYSTGGHVASGENYIHAAIREVKEELNLEIDESDLTLIRKFHFKSIPYIGCVFLLHTNATPNFNRDDFSDAQWMSPSEVIKKIDSGLNSKDSLRDTVLAIADDL